jgi:hypothetical protein
MAKGLELARALVDKVPEAKWLCDLFPDGAPSMREARVRFARSHEIPSTSLCYAYYVSDHRPNALFVSIKALIAACPVKHPLYEAETCDRDDKVRLIELVERRPYPEPIALMKLAQRISSERRAAGLSSFRKTDRQKELYKHAAELGSPDGCVRHATYNFAVNDPQHWYWFGKAFLAGSPHLKTHMARMERYLTRFVVADNHGKSRCIVEMARTIRAPTFPMEELVRRHSDLFDSAANIVLLYELWKLMAKDAVTTWLLVARRLRIVKDIRRVIGMIVWNTWFDSVEHTADGRMFTF